MKYHVITLTTMLLLLLLQSVAVAQGKSVTHYETGFAETNYYYPITQVPMTRLELELFATITDVLVEMEKIPPDKNGYMPNLSRASLINVKVSNQGDILVNLDKRILFDENGKCCAFREDFTGLLNGEIREIIAPKKMKTVRSSGFAYDGYAVEHYDSDLTTPPVAPAPIQSNGLVPQSKAAATAAGAKVVVSAGHGLYYHYGFKKWVAQRDPFYGITEDFITPVLADKLNTLLKERSKATTYLVRENPSSKAIHAPSKKPWWQVSARYYIQKLLPNLPKIWSTYSKPTATDREKQQDTNTRPLYANHLAADLLSIHTNAIASHTARGSRVYYDPKLADNKKLATSISCYMDELIHAVPAYKSFPVAPTPIDTTKEPKAEAKLPNKPNAIIETAFHDNPTDAAALKDGNFQTASMKGVEKGYRLFKENQPCKHFEIDNIPSPKIPNGQTGNVDIKFVGYPQFPVKSITEFVNCSAGSVCTGSGGDYTTKQSSPLGSDFFCSMPANAPTKTAILKTTLIDADGVTTKPFTYKVTCATH